MKPRRRRQGGFTLMEVLVSLVLGAIAMIGVIALYRASSSASSFSRRSTEAAVLAQGRLETLRTIDTGALVPLSPIVELTLNEQGKTVVNGPFTRTSIITVETVNTPARYHDIDVVVTWFDEGESKSITVRGRRTIQ